MIWRPLPSAILFAIAGPIIAAGVVLAILAPAIRNLGPFDASAPLDLLFGAFVIGLPPMAATGLFVGLGAQRGLGLPRLLLRAGVAGLVLAALSAVLLATFGPLISTDWRMLLSIAVVGAVAALIACLVAAVLLRRPRTGSDK